MDCELAAALVFQQAVLERKPPPVTGQFTVGGHHSMTRNQDGQRIRGVRAAHRASAEGSSNPACYVDEGVAPRSTGRSSDVTVPFMKAITGFAAVRITSSSRVISVLAKSLRSSASR
jgi:hypothetical protein